MKQEKYSNNNWRECRIGITGASGSLGKALTKKFKEKGAWVVGLTHTSLGKEIDSNSSPQEWIEWSCGKEDLITNTLEKLDILILNHGINPKGKQDFRDLNEALAVNALSTWRLIEKFETIALRQKTPLKPKEIWINTSEAEIQPALSPGYEVSKRLIGQLVSIRSNYLSKDQKKALIIRKLVLGPFRSNLNPIGIMSADFVASQIINISEFKLNLIIVTPNPLTYLIMPLVEASRAIYTKMLR